jgi:hypothetical protein
MSLLVAGRLPHVPTWSYNCTWDFLTHELPKLLEDVPLVVRAQMWYMHACALAYFSSAVADVLNNTSHDGWVGEDSLHGYQATQIWNFLDFYLWGHNLCMQLLLTKERHFTIAVCMPLRLPSTTQNLRMDAAVHDEMCLGVHWISWRTFWSLIQMYSSS